MQVKINDFDMARTCIRPGETHAPLDIDADAELPSSFARQRFKTVAGRTAQELQGLRRVQHLQLALGNRLDAAEPPWASAFEQGKRVAAAEGLDHSAKRNTLNGI